MTSNKNIIMLVPSLEQPRIIKRVIEKAHYYDMVDVLAYTRGIYDVKNYEKLNQYSNIKVIRVGSLINKTYLIRPIKYIKLYILILYYYGFRKKNMYVFGLDLRIFCAVLINKTLTYEISDIVWLYKSKQYRRFLCTIDFYLAKRSKTVVFTSEGFYNKYYSFLKKEKITIIENKFKSYSLVFPVQSIIRDKIRIAYIGHFRYDSIIEYLISFISNQDNSMLNFYGDGNSTALEIIKYSSSIYNNVFFYGAFKNPDDLERIYSENNLNFVVYDNKLENEKVAMPNKFYESGYFNIPIVCSKDTLVGEKVIKLDMGWAIDPTEKGIGHFFKNLSINDIIECHNRIKRLNKTMFESFN